MTTTSPYAIRPTSVVHVLEHQLRRNRATWTSALLTGVMNPVLMMLALGFGLGSQIDDTSSLGTSDYLHFVGPGVLAGTAMMQGGFYSLWPTMSMLKWEGNYQSVVRSPASPTDVATGHLLWVALRVTASSTLFYVVLLFATGWGSWLSLFTPVVAGLTALAMAASVCAHSTRVETDTSFSLISRMLITPLFVFSGTFTAVDELPSAVGSLIRLTPGYHGIELCRGLLNQSVSAADGVIHLVWLAGWIVGGWLLAASGFRRSLTP